jgi:hypothetical protein
MRNQGTGISSLSLQVNGNQHGKQVKKQTSFGIHQNNLQTIAQQINEDTYTDPGGHASIR